MIALSQNRTVHAAGKALMPAEAIWRANAEGDTVSLQQISANTAASLTQYLIWQGDCRTGVRYYTSP